MYLAALWWIRSWQAQDCPGWCLSASGLHSGVFLAFSLLASRWLWFQSMKSAGPDHQLYQLCPGVQAVLPPLIALYWHLQRQKCQLTLRSKASIRCWLLGLTAHLPLAYNISSVSYTFLWEKCADSHASEQTYPPSYQSLSMATISLYSSITFDLLVII